MHRFSFCGFSTPVVSVNHGSSNMHGTIIFIGGMSPNPNSQPLPDWVDATVADWIQTESKAMEEAWGPQESRAAIAFVHIPPSVARLFDILGSLMSIMLASLSFPFNLQTCHSGASIQSKHHQESGIKWFVEYSKDSFLIIHFPNLHSQINSRHPRQWVCSRLCKSGKRFPILEFPQL